MRDENRLNLGTFHETGKCGLAVNLSEARRYYQMAVDMGDASHIANALARSALARLDDNDAP